jgi:CheY-like chemotaxis protein
MPIRPKTTFLLAEDSPDDAYLVEMEFKKVTHLQLRVVKDGQEAIDYLQSVGPWKDRSKFPLPDVILLDLKMPRLGGFDFLEWMRCEAPLDVKVIPVMVMSGSNLEKDVKRAYELGANIYMTKPIDWQKFQELIKLMGVLWSEYAEVLQKSDLQK